jgi:hypothetical protein
MSPENLGHLRRIAVVLAEESQRGEDRGLLPLALMLRAIADEEETGVKLWGISESTFPINVRPTDTPA